MKNLQLGLIALLLFTFVSCEKEELDTNKNKKINTWVYENMKEMYLWESQIPDNMKNYESDAPHSYFNKLLYNENSVEFDKWSVLKEDVDEWIKLLNGRNKTHGMVLRPYELDNNKICGLVMYVEKSSIAEQQGIKRGDAILEINGITPNLDNYVEVLYYTEGNTEYTLGTFKNNNVTPTGKKVTFNKEVFQVNPIFESKIIERDGKKIAYLMYSSFLTEYDEELTQQFAYYKAHGVTDLVLDLRYNTGGYLISAIRLASLIAPKSTASKPLATKIFNEILEKEIDKESDPDNFRTIRFESRAENLDLKQVYIITSRSSASASEFVINGLKPYMDVRTIGDRTHGKFTASITVTDPKKEIDWAIQPILFKYANVNGDTDFWEGLPATISDRDDLQYELGDPEENLLKIALGEITGVPTKKLGKSNQMTELPYPIAGGGILHAGFKHLTSGPE